MEQFPLLSKLLIRLRSTKLKKEFVNYISKMEYEDFRAIWILYSNVLLRTVVKYQRSRFLTKNWFKLKSVRFYYGELYLLFSSANKEYLNRIMNEYDEFSNKVFSIIKTITERQIVLENIKNINLTTKENSENKILIVLVIMESIYSQEELNRAIEELKGFKRFR